MNEKDPIPLRPPPTAPPPLPPSFPPRVLNYGSPDLAPRRISILQVILGLIISPGVLFTVFMLVAMISDWVKNGFGMLTVIALALLGINVGAYLMYRNESLRGLAIGLWIGMGILLLLVGACFAMIS